jgi:hypothetical protein
MEIHDHLNDIRLLKNDTKLMYHEGMGTNRCSCCINYYESVDKYKV